MNMGSILELLTCGFVLMMYISSSQGKDFLLEERLIKEVQDLLNKLDNEKKPEKRTESEATYNAFMNEMKGLVAIAVGEQIDPVIQSAKKLKLDVNSYRSNSWLSKRSLDEQQVGVQGADSENSPDMIKNLHLPHEKKEVDAYPINTLKQLMLSTEARINGLLAEMTTLESQITSMENTAQDNTRKLAVTSSCTSRGSGYGGYSGCPASYAVTEVCGSGRYQDCRFSGGSYSTLVKCCQIQSRGASYGCYARSSDNGKQYRGTVHKTINGLTCQRWDSQTPHTHSVAASAVPEDTLSDAENYCRNPDVSARPWCYTTDSTRWEYCHVYPCEESIDIKHSDCETIRKGYGANAECPAGKYMVGTCGSGAALDCGNSASHYAHCCKLTGGRSIGSCGGWKYGHYGVVLKCSGQQVAVGYCGAGHWDDCYGRDSYSGIRCCDIE